MVALVVLALRAVFVGVWLALLALVLYLDATLVDPWAGCASDVGPFCERERPSRLMRERSNALSDFAFLALGLALTCTAAEDTLVPPTQYRNDSAAGGSSSSTGALSLLSHSAPSNAILRYPSLTLLYGLANIVHACGTWLNHSSRCHVGHRLDLCGMWLVSFFCSLTSIARLAALLAPSFCQSTGGGASGVKNVLPTFFFPFYLMAAWAFWLLSDVWYSAGSYDGIEPQLVVFNIALVALAELLYLALTLRHNSRLSHAGAGGGTSGGQQERYSGRYDVLALGAASIAVGAMLGRLDAEGTICWPDSVWQLHALWHVLACVCLGCLYAYYRLEHTPHISATARKER